MRTASLLPTIRDVAARAQVSICTASTILNRADRRALYTDETQSRVRTAADALGYVPSHRGRALQARRTATIGVIAPLMGDVFTSATIAAVDRAIRERQHHTLLIGSDDDALAAVEAGRVDALLALPTGMQAEDHARLELARGRVVLLLPRHQGALPGVVVDPRAGITEAVRHLHSLGHRSIAWLGPVDGAIVEAEARLGATRAEAARLAIAFATWAMREAPPHAEAWISAARAAALAGCAQAPATAVLCYNDQCAIGAYGAAAELGLRIGRDLSVIGYDDLHGGATSPALTSVSHMLDAAAVEAVDLLLGSRLPGRSAVRTVDSRLIIHASTAPPTR